jgi:hypothetical protein
VSGTGAAEAEGAWNCTLFPSLSTVVTDAALDMAAAAGNGVNAVSTSAIGLYVCAISYRLSLMRLEIQSNIQLVPSRRRPSSKRFFLHNIYEDRGHQSIPSRSGLQEDNTLAVQYGTVNHTVRPERPRDAKTDRV